MAKKPKEINIEALFSPHVYQTELFTGWKRWNLAITCRGWGKTVAAVMALHQSALVAQAPLTYAYIAPVKAQAWDVIRDAISEFVEPLQEYGVLRVKESAMEIHYLQTGCIIKCYGADYPNNKVIRGKTFGGVVVDEFDSTDPEVWDKIIRPCLRKYKGWALLIGTIEPGSNLIQFRDQFQDEPTWQCRTYKFSECWRELPAYDEDEYNSIIVQYANKQEIFAREYECDETATGEDVVIPTALIYDARGKHIPLELYRSLPKVMGVDVATGSGRDTSTICQRQGLACEPIHEYNLDNMEFADVVARLMDKWEPDAVFIDKGRGEGVISRLRQLGYSVIGVDFGGKATRPDIYGNKRTEMYCGIAEWLEMGGVLPDDKNLVQELTAPILKAVASEKKMMERKDDIKKRIGRSPDLADALALTFAAPVRSKGQRSRRKHNKTLATYNPLKAKRR